jgi:hypothetical protein
VKAFRWRDKRGQAMVEFVVMVGLIMAALGALWALLWTFTHYGTRVIDLVASEYP